jgi:hypothetical protein
VQKLHGSHVILCCEGLEPSPESIRAAAELAAYVWERDESGSGRNRPADRDNHLMDALRYAMEDAVYARPMVATKGARGGIRAGDLQGGWTGQ